MGKSVEIARKGCDETDLLEALGQMEGIIVVPGSDERHCYVRVRPGSGWKISHSSSGLLTFVRDQDKRERVVSYQGQDPNDCYTFLPTYSD